MFLRIVDLPPDQRERFVEWGMAIMSAYEPEQRMAAQVRVRNYLKQLFRRARRRRRRGPADARRRVAEKPPLHQAGAVQKSGPDA